MFAIIVGIALSLAVMMLGAFLHRHLQEELGLGPDRHEAITKVMLIASVMFVAAAFCWVLLWIAIGGSLPPIAADTLGNVVVANMAASLAYAFAGDRPWRKRRAIKR